MTRNHVCLIYLLSAPSWPLTERASAAAAVINIAEFLR